jgi:hypothetical protein
MKYFTQSPPAPPERINKKTNKALSYIKTLKAVLFFEAFRNPKNTNASVLENYAENKKVKKGPEYSIE